MRRADQAGNRHRMFARAAPPDWYLIALSKARVIRTYGLVPTPCHIDIGTGEEFCVRTGAPKGEDCRLPTCRYGALMRMRLISRLREAYARERRKHVAP